MTRTEIYEFKTALITAQTNTRAQLQRCEQITVQKTCNKTHIRERVANTVLPPAWLTRALLPLGIYTEITGNALTNAGWLEASEVSANEEAEHLSKVTHMGGGYFRSLLNASQAEVQTVSRALLQTTKQANQNHKILRYTILAKGGGPLQHYVKSNGGKILAAWGPEHMQLQPTASVFTHYTGPAMRNVEPLFLAMWETAKIEEAWGIPEDFWKMLLEGNEADGNMVPVLRESQGWTKHKQLRHTRQQPAEERDGWDQPLWEELQHLEKKEPHLFWASRIPTLRSQPDFRPELPKRNKAHLRVTVRIGAVALERNMPIDTLKLPENAEERKACCQG